MRAVLHCHIGRFLSKSTLPELSNFGESPGRAGGLPIELNVFRRSPLGIPAGDREWLAKGDRAYDAAFSPKKPTQFSQRHGDIITYDHTPGDVFVLYKDDGIRPQLTTCIDPVSGACRGIFVSPTPAGSAEVALVIRGAIREKSKLEDPYQILCGLPKRVYADRGRDMLSAHIRAALHDLGIEDSHGQGYRPYSRGSIEGNLHKLIHTRFEPELPGYGGSDVKTRRPDTKAVLTFEEYADLLRHWVFTVFNHLKYTAKWLNGKRPSRLDVALDNHAPIVMPSADAMMFALLKRKTLTVQDTGVHFGRLFVYQPRFQNDERAFMQLIHERAQVELRYDPAAMGVTYPFRQGRLLMELHDAKAERAQATEKDKTYFEALRARTRKETRERLRPDREAANSPDEYLEYLEEQRAEAEAMPVAAVAGGGRTVVRRILPLDHARRGPSQRSSSAPAPPPRQRRTGDWKTPWGKQ